MDVDLLRPGNVPISPNTVLWFEFLVRPGLLEEHLKKPNPDPVPTDLLIKFLMLSVEPHSIDEFEKTKNFKCSKRQLCMKVLAFKIIAHWNWDLEIIESKLPLQLQYVLLRDFLCLTNESSGECSYGPIKHNTNLEELYDQHIFALSLYHRWALHVIVNSPMVSRNILYMSTMNVPSADEIMSNIMDDESKSEEILQKIIALRRDVIMIPTFHSFTIPTEKAEQVEDWNEGLDVQGSKFYCQIFYDLGAYKVYRELTNDAKEYFTSCKNLYDQITNSKVDRAVKGFCEVNEESLTGFCYACGVCVDQNRSLTLQFYSSIRNNYANIIAVLQADNLAREIPLTYRDSFELDLASTLASGKFTATRDLLFQIQTLNVVRRVLEGVTYSSVLEYAALLDAFNKGNKILINALKLVLGKATIADKQKIKLFLLILFNKRDSSRVRGILDDDDLSALFTEDELKEALSKSTDESLRANFLYLTNVEKTREQKIKMIGNNQLEICMLERQIIKTYEPSKLKELIRKFSSFSGNRPIINVCNKWRVVPLVCQAITSLPTPFMQQYCYVVLAKVKELVDLQNFKMALDLLDSAQKEVKKRAFGEFLRWEVLYVSMVELQTMVLNSVSDRNMTVEHCKEVLDIVQPGIETDYLPRQQIIDLAAITVLNAEPEYLANCNYQKRMYPFLDLAIALSLACMDMSKFKNNKKFTKEAWDLVMPAFENANLNLPKRQLGVDCDMSKMALIQFFIRLRNTNVVNLILSLLARIYNVLRDEPNLELYFMYVQLWPPNILNGSAYNPDNVVEVLAIVLDEVLKHQPTNGSWLKLAGDVNFVKGHYSAALKKYFETLVSASEYFIRPVPKTVVEDFVYRRMVKCCMMMQCFTQAAVLCQFLDEVDYTTAFKCLSETMSADATDCYYDCMWDVNVLEFLIALHSKRNEHSKKQKAIEVIGLLELNSNNNEEIKREATNMRKTKFLRAMAKQYVIH